MNITDLKNYTVIGGANTGIPESVVLPKKTTGQKILDAGTSVANFFGAKGISEQFGANIARSKADTKEEKNAVEFPTQKEVVGSAIQTGANLIPGVGKGIGLLGKTAIGAGTGLAFDVGSKLQNDQPVTPGVGTAVGAALPVVGAVVRPVVKIVGRLLKGLGSGLSGVSTDTINKIVDNPKYAQEASNRLAKSGNSKILEENAKVIVNGVPTIRQQARKAFGEGLDELAETDIQPDIFRQGTQKILDKYGSVLDDGERVLKNVEFDDPKNIQKASKLIDRLSNVEMDGKSLRKLSDDIENASYKTATSDERLSFNAFIKDLSETVKGTISQATPKLQEINKTFSQDMQLAEAAEDIFGKVDFKNLSEVVKASQKLETLFSQKGLAPDVVDRFLNRLGVDPGDFKTNEAVRQISNKQTGANTKGLSVGEAVQQVTSAVVTPQMIRDISIKSGLTREKLVPFLKGMNPSARNIFINALLKTNSSGRSEQLQQP